MKFPCSEDSWLDTEFQPLILDSFTWETRYPTETDPDEEVDDGLGNADRDLLGADLRNHRHTLHRNKRG